MTNQHASDALAVSPGEGAAPQGQPKPKVSIIITNYNYGRFLDAAVTSALSQSYQNCEVIVVDDGSTDNSCEVLEQFAGKIIVLYQSNCGQASAQNAGYAVSAGGLVCFLDSDDVLFQEAISSIVSIWRDDVASVHFRLEILTSTNERTGMLTPRCKLPQGHEVIDQILSTGRYVWSPTSGNVYSRPFLQTIFPIPEKDWEHGDSFINVQAPFYGRVLAIQQPLAFYRVHGKSLSSVFYGDAIDKSQLLKLLGDCEREEQFMCSVARKHGFTSIAQHKSNWMKLKLQLSLCRLTAPKERQSEIKTLVQSMLSALASATGMSLWQKLQFAIWTVCVGFLPRDVASGAIKLAFDRAPSSSLSRFLRKS